MNSIDIIKPLIFSDKFKNKGIYSPFSFDPGSQKNEGEVFEIVTDISAPNVIPGRYMVSNFGRIWDCFDKKFMPYSYNRPYNEDGTNDGYIKTKLVCYESFDKTCSRDRYCHRLVLSTFEPNHNTDRCEVNHKDGNKENNNIENLEWVTPEENKIHAINIGLLEKGFVQNISNETVIEICKKLSEGIPNSIISKELNVPTYTVTDIKRRKIFNNISKNYKFKDPDVEIYGYTTRRPNNMIEEICKKIVSNESATNIAKEFDIDRGLVYKIINREYYTDISSKYDFSNYNNKKFTSDEKVHNVCKLLSIGYVPAKIESVTGVSRRVIERIRKGEAYTEISSQYTIPKARKMQSKLNEDQIRKVCELLQSGEGLTNTSIHSGIKYQIVQNIWRRLSYTNISKDYNW